jgi:flagellar hook-length control protein FliK
MTSTISSKIPDPPASRLFASGPGNGAAGAESSGGFASALENSRMRQHERTPSSRDEIAGTPPRPAPERSTQTEQAPRPPARNDAAPEEGSTPPPPAGTASAPRRDSTAKEDEAGHPDAPSESAAAAAAAATAAPTPAQADQPEDTALADAANALIEGGQPIEGNTDPAGEGVATTVIAEAATATGPTRSAGDLATVGDTHAVARRGAGPLPTDGAHSADRQSAPASVPDPVLAAEAAPGTEPPEAALVPERAPLPPDPARLAATAPTLAAASVASTLTDTLAGSDANEPATPGTAPRNSLDALIGRLFGANPAAAGREGSGTGIDQAIRDVLEGGKLQNAGRLPTAETGLSALQAGASGMARSLMNASASASNFANALELAAQAGSGAARPATASPLDPQSSALVSGLNPALRAGEQAPIQLPVPTPAGQKAWAEEVGGRLLWMAGRGESRAELVLTPPNLGKIGISLHMNGDQTSAHFIAATPAAREVLEQAMPRLREVLQQAGIQLGEANVSTSGEHGTREHGDANRSPFAGRGPSNPTGDGKQMLPLPPPSGWTRGGAGVIDIFA